MRAVRAVTAWLTVVLLVAVPASALLDATRGQIFALATVAAGALVAVAAGKVAAARAAQTEGRHREDKQVKS